MVEIVPPKGIDIEKKWKEHVPEIGGRGCGPTFPTARERRRA